MTAPDNNTLIRYFQGEASEDDLQQILDFIRADRKNAQALFSAQSLHDRLEASTITPDQTEQALQCLMRRVDTESNEQESEYSAQRGESAILRRIPLWLRVAAVAVIGILVGAGAMYIYNNGIRQADTLVVVATKVEKVCLPDGSRVWLNTGGRLEYPEQFADKARRVKLEGEGYFEVAKDSVRPFLVQGAGFAARVYGTKFNFSTSKATGTSELTLIEGSVGLRNDKTSEVVMLHPGQKAEGNATTGHVSVAEVDAQLSAVWHDNLMNFQNARLTEIAAALQDVYGVNVTIDPRMDLTHTYSGYIRRKQSINSVMALLQKSIPMHFSINGNTVHIQP